MQRLTNDEIDALLTQQTPSVREGDADVASLIADLRHAFHPTTPPAPTAELAAYLDLTVLAARLADIATAPTPAPASQPAVLTRSAPSKRTVRTRRLVVWLSGLGLAGQVGLGATAAVAAVAGAGVAGALPDPAQTVFNEVVATLVPGADTDTSQSDSRDDTPLLEDSSLPAVVTPTEHETNKPRHKPTPDAKPTPDKQNTPAKQPPDSDAETQPVVRNPQAPSDDDTGVEDEASEQTDEQADNVDDTRDVAEDQADTTASDPDTVDPPETTGGDPSRVQNPDETTANDAPDNTVVEITPQTAAEEPASDG